MDNIIVATVKPWNIENFHKLKKRYANRFHFHLITKKEALRVDFISKLSPTYLFFPHWSWRIQKEIYQNYECVLFHMTDLPYGRGGSPLQNLIMQGVYDTKISALRVTEEIDAGAIFCKEPFNIALGSAEEIYMEASRIIFDKMIPKIIDEAIIPKKQEGKVTTFKRRTPAQSDLMLLEDKNLQKLYDFIRMLDAHGYPKAFIDLGEYIIELSEAHRKDGKVVGKFEVRKK